MSASSTELTQQINHFSQRARELGAVSLSDSRFAAAVLYRGLVDEERLKTMIAAAQEAKTSLSSYINEQGILGEEAAMEISAIAAGLPFIQLDPMAVSSSILIMLKPEIARMHNAVPVSSGEVDGKRVITIALADPASAPTKNALERLFSSEGAEVHFVAAHPERVAQVLKTRYETLAEDSDFDSIEEEVAEDIDQLMDEGNAGPARQYYARIFQDAVAANASDLHFEVAPDGRNMLVRMRVDGVMHELVTVPERYRRALVAVIKLDMDLDVADERHLKNGRVTKKIHGREVDFRGANWVTTRGEELVVRLLDREKMSYDIEGLGLSTRNLKVLKDSYESSFGSIIVCGPTGSGKSSTLYSILNDVASPEKVILTIEDPVEYRMAGIQQTQVIPHLDRDFPDSLRNALRCDPDVIMVGEVRDELTAEISMRAAISGHLLLTTLHAMEAASAPIQLIRMGVPAYQVADALRLIVSQRLVRLLCPHCKVAATPTPMEIQALGYSAETAQAIIENISSYNFHTHSPDGCSQCTKGYKGRSLIAEVMPVGDEEKELLLSEDRSALSLRRLAQSKGMNTLGQDGMEKAAQGITSLAEIRRVVG